MVQQLSTKSQTGKVIVQLKGLGWFTKPSKWLDMRYNTCLFAPWAVEAFNARDKSKLLEGRDYFLEYEDVVEYIKAFGLEYDEVGLSVSFNNFLLNF